MSRKIVAGFGALLMLAGLLLLWRGAEVIQLERGWAQFIAGASVFSAGAIVWAIAALMGEVGKLVVTQQAAGREVPAFAAAPPTAFEPPSSLDAGDGDIIPGEELAPLRAAPPAPAPANAFVDDLRSEPAPEPSAATAAALAPSLEARADAAPQPRRSRMDFAEAFRRRSQRADAPARPSEPALAAEAADAPPAADPSPVRFAPATMATPERRGRR